MKRSSSLFAIVALFLLFPCAGSLRAQDDLQFNVPYTCSDGVTYVVHKCLTGPKGEMCYYQAEGQSERYNTRAAVVYQMTKMCKPKGSPSAPATTAQPSSELQLDTPYQCSGGTLNGSGSVEVNGRKIYRSSRGDIAYTPQNARCTLGTLTPNK